MVINQKIPKISVLMSTYNRASLLPRAIDCILDQTYQDFEIVVVNNGSTDETKDILDKKYAQNEKIRIFHLEKNIGATGGFNFAMDNINGEWFTLFCDDDILFPTCLETLINIPKNVDPSVNAVTCNVIDSSTKKMAGFGLDCDQYLTQEVIINRAEGEFFGITKTELLGEERFNANLISHDCTFWYKIDAKANRYYIHQALRLFTTGGDTLTSKDRFPDLKRRIELYKELYKETFYFDVLKKHSLPLYIRKCFKGLFFMKISANEQAKKVYQQRLSEVLFNTKDRLLFTIVNNSAPWVLRQFYAAIGKHRYLDKIL